ncbi:helix-turn-helix domain-containing protein [Mucilaginibacter sp.]|uniref:helix-turn-helix transcriptional regulator n=1 Tax=Mucilaginibacter sp. TaxID=1882438 RepID=UPI00326508A9
MDKITFEQLPEMVALLLAKVERLENLLVNGKDNGITLKEMLTIVEASEYMGISKSSLYKMTMRSELPTYRPGGKKVYLKRTEINDWLASQRRNSNAEIEQQAINYMVNNPMGKRPAKRF